MKECFIRVRTYTSHVYAADGNERRVEESKKLRVGKWSGW